MSILELGSLQLTLFTMMLVGALYTSIFLIPMRIVMWSVGTTNFVAGETAAIFAAKYGSDAPFAARNVVFTTLLSMLTLPLWAYAVG